MYLDGSWYHFDATWNDPIPDLLGASRHGYFLLSTEEMLRRSLSSADRSDWYCDENVSCTDTTYDNFYWSNVETPFVELGGYWYYGDTEAGAICRTTDLKTPGKPFIKLGSWPMLDSSFNGEWLGIFTGLGSYGNWLIYNTADQLLAYNTESGETRTVFTTPDSSRDIYSFQIKGDTATCALSVSPYGEELVFQTCSLKDLPVMKKTVFRGITIRQGDGEFLISGKSTSDEPFLITVAVYGSTGQMQNIKVISSADVTNTPVRWLLRGDRTTLFLLNTHGALLQ